MERVMSKEANEATSLILQILHLANPNPPEKAVERVEQMRKLLAKPKEEEPEKKRRLIGGHDRQDKGGRDREGK
jgi:hypothetical protein